MRESSKAALGGIVSALAIVFMLSTYLSPLLVYSAPPFAGLLIVLVLKEIGYSWAIGTYTAVSLLSVFLIADKEAAVFFTFFFGYYPILRVFFNSKIKIKTVSFSLCMIIFNIALAVSVCISAFVFNIDYSDFTEGGKAMTALFIGLMNIVFIVYDYLLLRILDLYDSVLKKRFRKLFHR